MFVNRFSVRFLCAIIVFAFAGPAVAGDLVPFKGSLEGTATVTPLTPLEVAVDVQAIGNSTLLGLFAVEIPHVVDRSDFTAAGTYTFTAANGDKVYADFEGYSMPTDVPNVIAIVEHAEIVDGTGRFAGATGSFTTWRLFNRVTGETIGAFGGSISAP